MSPLSVRMSAREQLIRPSIRTAKLIYKVPVPLTPWLVNLQLRRQATSFAAFTLAQPPVFPTSPKISSRTLQIARHISSSSSSSSPHSSSSSSSTTNMASQYKVRKIGAPNTLAHRVYIEKDGQVISPFHDIPLWANEQQGVANMVVEFPRWTNAKLEVCVFFLLVICVLILFLDGWCSCSCSCGCGCCCC
jgi:hypothetical protein